MAINMTQDEFEMLKNAMDQENIDTALLKDLVINQIKRTGNVSPMLQDLANAFLFGDEDRIMKEAHKVRSIAIFVAVKFVWDSKFYLVDCEKK